MAELEVDQSNLPRVQEVSQYFSVLEDGALAHNLQEQEIEQYYSSNIQRNQLVQKDIRVAKRLQNEEQERAQMLHEQATRQLEDQDSEYAHRIQEEIQHAAEEERRREEKDEEIAKRIQEEEDLRQRNSCRRTDGRVNGITIGSPNTLQPRQPLFREEEESARHSWVRSPSSSTSDYEAEHCEHRRPLNRDSTNSFEQRRQSVREQPLRRRSVQSRSSFASQSSTTGNLQGGWTDVVQLIKNDLNEQGYLSCSSEDELFEPVYKLERILSRQSSERHGVQGTRLSRHSSMREGNTRMWSGDQVSRMERYRHSDYKDSRSVGSASRPVRRYSSSDCKSGDRQRRVRFQEGNNFYTDVQRAFEENHVGKRNPRNCTVRPYQGNVSGDRRTSWGEINRPCRYEAKGVRTSLSQETREDEEYSGRFRERGSFEGGSCRVQTEHRPKAHSVRKEWRQEGRESRQYCELQSSRHARGEHWQGNQGDRSSTEEEEMDREYERRREETRAPRQPRRSLSASFRGRSPGPGQSMNRPSLDLGELRQVLQDEELARKLQEEEEELLKRDLATSPCISYPQGDFTVAQVAQDEEIAHFMQKQEIKSTLRSRVLEDCSSGQEYRDMSPVYDNREVYDGQMPRERRNSEGLVSPGNECSPEHRPPDSVTLTEQQNPFRNIAEELDPTFQRNEIVRSGPETLQMHPTSQTESSEEPAFVAPTKRQNDKPVRAKSKEKKDSKSKENCKQQ